MRFFLLLLVLTLPFHTMARREPRRHSAPSVTLRDYNGKDTTLVFRHNGKRYIMLNFWASWCQPCHNEIPNLRRIYKKYHKHGLDIIGISTDQDMTEWKNELDKLNEPWQNYIDQQRRSVTDYNVKYIPHIVIINSKGTIVSEKLRGKELSDFIDGIFK